MEDQQNNSTVPSLDPADRTIPATPNKNDVVNLDNDEEARQDMRDDESLMDFGSGSGGGSAGDGGDA